MVGMSCTASHGFRNGIAAGDVQDLHIHPGGVFNIPALERQTHDISASV